MEWSQYYSCSAEKSLEVLAEGKLAMSQQCVPVAKNSKALVCSSSIRHSAVCTCRTAQARQSLCPGSSSALLDQLN